MHNSKFCSCPECTEIRMLSTIPLPMTMKDLNDKIMKRLDEIEERIKTLQTAIGCDDAQKQRTAAQQNVGNLVQHQGSIIDLGSCKTCGEVVGHPWRACFGH